MLRGHRVCVNRFAHAVFPMLRHFRRLFRWGMLMLVLMAAFSPSASAAYSLGIVGCYARSNVTSNVPAEWEKIYDMAYDALMFELSDIPGVDFADLSEQGKMARKDEIEFQRRMEALGQGEVAVVINDFNVKPDYIVYGYLNGLTVTHRESLLSSNYAVRVDISIRVLDAQSGKIVFVSTGAGDASEHVFAGGKTIRISSDAVPEANVEKAIIRAFEKIGKNIRHSV